MVLLVSQSPRPTVVLLYIIHHFPRLCKMFFNIFQHFYDHFFPLRSKAQKGMKNLASIAQHSKIVLKYCLRKQVHYRVRGGEWAQRKLNRIFMCTDGSFKHKFVGLRIP